MSWQSHNQRDDEEAEWRKLSLRERYDWPSLLLFAVFVGVCVWALLDR